MIEVARVLNKTADMEAYRQLGAAVKRSFNEQFFDKQRLQYDSAQSNGKCNGLVHGPG
jgi:hypothetical protein